MLMVKNDTEKDIILLTEMKSLQDVRGMTVWGQNPFLGFWGPEKLSEYPSE